MASVITKDEQDRLVAAAQKASDRAYAPFSKFFVGAAILTSTGQTYTGCNVENSSYGLTNCAERTAIFSAIADAADNGKLEIRAVAAIHRDGLPCAPCGACRQVIFEFGSEAIVIYRAANGEFTQTPITSLLPEGFRLGQ
jgi:cytidine deaminase